MATAASKVDPIVASHTPPENAITHHQKARKITFPRPESNWSGLNHPQETVPEENASNAMRHGIHSKGPIPKKHAVTTLRLGGLRACTFSDRYIMQAILGARSANCLLSRSSHQSLNSLG